MTKKQKPLINKYLHVGLPLTSGLLALAVLAAIEGPFYRQDRTAIAAGLACGVIFSVVTTLIAVKYRYMFRGTVQQRIDSYNESMPPILIALVFAILVVGVWMFFIEVPGEAMLGFLAGFSLSDAVTNFIDRWIVLPRKMSLSAATE